MEPRVRCKQSIRAAKYRDAVVDLDPLPWTSDVPKSCGPYIRITVRLDMMTFMDWANFHSRVDPNLRVQCMIRVSRLGNTSYARIGMAFREVLPKKLKGDTNCQR